MTDFANKASATLAALTIGKPTPLTRYGQTFAEIVRLSPLAASNPPGIGDLDHVTIADFQDHPMMQTERLLEGGAFVLTRNRRRVAIVRGVRG